MLKLMKTKLLVAVLSGLALVAGGGSASAAFTLSVAYVGGTGSGAVSWGAPFSTGTSPVSVGDLYGDGPGIGNDLSMSANFSSNPGIPTYNLNSLLVGWSPAVPGSTITVDVTLTETAAIYPVAAGQPLYGYTSHTARTAAGSTSSLDSAVTTYDGTGATSIVFPAAILSTTPQNFAGNTLLTAGSSPATITTTYRMTIGSDNFVRFDNLANGTGTTSGIPSPAPPALLVGLFAVPTLALLRRRIRK